MILISAYASRALAAHSETRLWVEVAVTALTGSVVRFAGDLQALADGGCGVIRRSVRPLTREFEMSLSGLNLDNAYGRLTWRSAASDIYGIKLIGGEATVDLMIPLGAMPTESIRLYTGILASLSIGRDGSFTMKLTDPQEKIRQSSTGSKAGTTMADDSPAGLIYTLLGSGYAGIDAAYIDTATFTGVALEERLDRHVVRGFEIGTGSWLDQINAILAYSSAVLALDRYGKITYRRMVPDVTVANSMEITETDGLVSIRLSKDLATVRNQAHVERWNGSAFVKTTASPLGDAASVSDYGERWDRARQFRYFDDDASANLTAGQDVFYQSQPIEVVELEADLPYLVLDVLDGILMNMPSLGLSDTFRIFETVLDLSTQTVKLTAMNTKIENQSWLVTDSGHLLDGSKRVF